MKIKRIIAVTAFVFVSSFLYAKKSDIDTTIRLAAGDIAEKCNAKSILVVDDFSTPSAELTSYIREQLADSIYAQDGLIQIVTREHLNIIRKESRFQNSGEVSERTIVSVAEKLGANSVIFGTLEELNTGYVLRIRMLDVKTGSYIFRKTYEVSRSSKTEQLLGRAAVYYKSAIGVFVEVNKNSLEYIAPAAGISFDYAFARKFSAGIKLTASYDAKEKDNSLFVMEPVATARYYAVSPFGEPVSGLFLEPQIGASLLFVNSEMRGVFNAGLGVGFRFALNHFYVEPEIRGGYPYLFGIDVAAGFRF